MIPAAHHFDPMCGIDVHIILTPAGVPCPIPHPHCAILIDPFDYLPILGSTVKIRGMHRAQAGTAGITLMPHIPLGGSFIKPPGNENEIFMGSSTVSIDGDAMSFLSLPVLSCQCIGMPPIPRAKKGAQTKTLVLPTTVVLSIPTSVNVGGSPTVSLMALGARAAMGALFAGIGAVARKVSKFRKARKARKAQNGVTCNGAHPVDIITGHNFDEFTDAKSGDGLFQFRRFYTTAHSHQPGPLGFGFRHSYQHTLSLRQQAWVYETPEGHKTYFEPLHPRQTTTRSAGLVLKRTSSGRLQVIDRTRPVLEFTPLPEGSTRLTSIIGKTSRLQLRYTERKLAEVVEGETRYHLHYDRFGRIVGLQKGDDQNKRQLATYRYDRAGNLVQSIHATGGEFRYEYDEAHRWTRVVDPRGFAYWWTYDARGRCTETSGQDGLWWTKFDYFPEKRETHVTERSGGTSIYRYDENNTLIELIDPYGGVTKRVVDDEGRVREVIDSGGRVTRWIYDGNGAHHRRLDRFGYLYLPEEEDPKPADPLEKRMPATAIEWLVGKPERAFAGPNLIDDAPTPIRDTADKFLASVIQPANDIRVEFDDLGRPIALADMSGRAEHRKYDSAGNLVERTDRDGRTHRREITSWNLIGREIDPLGRAVRYAYNSTEQVTRIVDPIGNTCGYDYDEKDRLVRVRHGDDILDRYEYDIGDHLIEKRDSRGELLVRYEWNEHSLCMARQLASGGVHRFAYDSWGQPTRASTERDEVELIWHSDGWVLSDRRNDHGVVHGVRGQTRNTTLLGRYCTRYETRDGITTITDPTGAVHQLRVGLDGSVLRHHANGTYELAHYDPAGRCVGQLRWNGQRSKHTSVHYQYSPEGDLLERTDSERGSTRYLVDSAHRLIAEKRPLGTIRYELDAASNLLQKPGLQVTSLADGNRLAHANSESFTYDHRGRIVKRASAHGRSAHYIYDSLDQLIGVHDDKEVFWTAEYDGLGRRVRSGRGHEQTEFYWDHDRLAAEISPTGALRMYIYADVHALVPLLFVDYPSCDSDPADGIAYALFTDQLGMPTRAEDMAGRMVWSAEPIDAYGALSVDPASTIQLHIRWPGHYYDAELGLHYNRFRYYDPHLGRYIQSDPKGQAGGINLHAYLANPLTSVDLLGLAHPSKGTANSADATRTARARDPNAEVGPAGYPVRSPDPKRADRYPPVTPAAKAEAAKVAKAADELGIGTSKARNITVFTHGPDGDTVTEVSVGLSGRKFNPDDAAALERKLNAENPGVTYRVSSEVDPKLDAELAENGSRMCPPNNCGEPRAASAANKADNPVNGYESIDRKQASSPEGTPHMPPCDHCGPTNGDVINDHAGGST